MVSADFSLQNSLGKVQFLEETFLLVNTSIDVILGMLFLAHDNINIQFSTEKPTWRSYILVEIWFITSWVELIEKKEFAKTALNENSEIFVIYIAV